MNKSLLRGVSYLILLAYPSTPYVLASNPIAPVQGLLSGARQNVISSPTSIECESQQASTFSIPSSAFAFFPSTNLPTQNITQGGIGGTVGNIVSFFTDMVSGLIDDFNISNVVNVQQIFNQIMSGELPPETIMANAIENNLPNSYTQRKDYAETLQRKAAIATVEDTTLGQAAQEKTLDNCLYVTDATNKIYDLAQESLTLDTSQQILQNISAQMGQKASVDQVMKEEFTRIRQDLALGTVLQSQVAEEIHESNIAQRRASIAGKNLESLNAGSLTMPGGLW
jgi:hypothetical protein